MKNNKISITFDEEDGNKFNEIAEKTKWSDKVLITMVLRDYYKKFKLNWEKAMIDALKR